MKKGVGAAAGEQSLKGEIDQIIYMRLRRTELQKKRIADTRKRENNCWSQVFENSEWR